MKFYNLIDGANWWNKQKRRIDIHEDHNSTIRDNQKDSNCQPLIRNPNRFIQFNPVIKRTNVTRMLVFILIGIKSYNLLLV